ncbi:putative norsolorinic acid reductase protein [Lasiodiplodia theobromae]|uniref:Norsolorinic acid reductase B n=1 Tax=Lasiodiplodia theobromae TaxID=45133 RepID=A0A5N5DFZ2_9PEZI|nr:Norsolorinic acid reductase B [Lasiodiplodia theobromae]KAF9632059.1 putative norsolorinic acid reductase protein [Lasiodiplodia theobromae]
MAPPGVPADKPKSLLARHRQLAPNASIRVSPLCLGAMTFGTSHQERYGEITKEEAFAILDTFYTNGGNFIDTANAYQDGESEMWLGEWMAARQNRDELVLATKYTSASKPHPSDAIGSNYGGNGTKSMRLSLEHSLRKLQTTYIDLFYLHWWDYSVTIPELMHALNDLVSAGKVHYLGISDTPAWIVAKCNQYARDHGLRPFVVYQGMWNAAMRDFERDIIPMCRDEGMGLCPYGTLNQGRFQTAEGFRRRAENNPGRKFVPLSQRDVQVSKVLEEVADAKGVPLLSVALAYVIQKTPYVFPIVGGRKVEHIQGSIDALSVALTEEEIERVESAYDFDPGFPHTFLSGTMFQEGAKPKAAQGPADVWLTRSLGNFDWVETPTALRPAEL